MIGGNQVNKIYTGIDIGTNDIKVIVACIENDKFHVLASVSESSSGIKKGLIVDAKKATISIKKAMKKASDMVGVKLTKVVTCVPTHHCNMDIVVGRVDISSDVVTGEDVTNVLKDAIIGRVKSNEELITSIPIHFTIDDKEDVKDPKGMSASTLDTKVVITTMDKELLYQYLEVLKLSGLDTIDIAFSLTGDYYAARNDDLDKSVGVILNIGEETTNIAVFNKGIMIKSDTLDLGSKLVDNDISYIYKTSSKDSRYLKENFAVASSTYADRNDVEEITTKSGEKKRINQMALSKVVGARAEEILKLSKKRLNNLTNREIRYIIVTGGLSELAGFQYLVEDIFGSSSKVCNIKTLGVRHNKYSSVLGILMYLDDKLRLRGKEISMFDDNDIEQMVTVKKRESNETIVSKVFGHFFDS